MLEVLNRHHFKNRIHLTALQIKWCLKSMGGEKLVIVLPMFILHSRESKWYCYILGGNARNLLEVVIYEVSGPPVFHIKVGACFYVPCPRTQQAKLPACSPQHPLNAEQQTGSCGYHFLISFGMTRQRE